MLHTDVLILRTIHQAVHFCFLYVAMYILFFKYKFKNKGLHVKDGVILSGPKEKKKSMK